MTICATLPEVSCFVYGIRKNKSTYFLKSLKSPQKGKNRLKLFLQMAQEIYGKNFNHTTIEDVSDDEVLGFADIGVVARHSPGEVDYFTFVEVTKQMRTKSCISLPGGAYFFRLDEDSQLANALEIFKEHLVGIDKFMILETEEPFLSRGKINQPAHELRLVVL